MKKKMYNLFGYKRIIVQIDDNGRVQVIWNEKLKRKNKYVKYVQQKN